MHSLENELRQLCQMDPDIVQMLEAFEEIEEVYRQTLEAMGIGDGYTSHAGNSAEVTLSLQSVSSFRYQ